MDNLPEQEDYDLSLPITALDGLYGDDFQHALAMFCTPFDKARKGDVVGFIQDYKAHLDGMISFPITQFIVALDDDASTFGRARFLQLPEQQRAEISHGAMTVQSASLKTQDLWHAATPIESGDGEPTYIEAFITPQFLIISVENYIDEVFEGRYFDCEIDQEVIENAFLGILPGSIESAHEAIEAAPLLPRMTAFANCLLPIPDPEDRARLIPMTPPDLATIQS